MEKREIQLDFFKEKYLTQKIISFFFLNHRSKTWDYTQRKVVRYDHSLGDAIELRGGHGTKVAGVAAGQAFDDVNDKANGIAQAAKLHIFDIQTRSGKIIDI